MNFFRLFLVNLLKMNYNKCVKGAYMNIEEELMLYQDKKYAEFQKKIIPSSCDILGVRIPILRKLAKKWVCQDPNPFIEKEHHFMEEKMLAGIMIGYQKLCLSDLCLKLNYFFKDLCNWAIVDVTVSSISVDETDLEAYFSFLENLCFSKEEYVVRFALVSFLNLYIQKEKTFYFSRIFHLCDEIDHPGYYVQMAIAWLISIAYIKDKEKTKIYLNQNQLSSWMYQKSLSKMIESNRLSQEEKEQIKYLKQHSRRSS